MRVHSEALRERIRAGSTQRDHGFVSACWIWNGRKEESGYCRFFVNGTRLPVHRAAHEAFKGEVGEGLQIDHLCRVRSCCNPDHLEAVTPSENIMRARALSRTGVCARGHAVSGDSVITLRSGVQTCRVCNNAYHREWQRKYRARQRATRHQQVSGDDRGQRALHADHDHIFGTHDHG